MREDEPNDETGLPPTQRFSQVCEFWLLRHFDRRMLIVDRFANMVSSTEHTHPVRGSAVVNNL